MQPLVLMCAESNAALARPYARLLQQLGVRVLQGNLFAEAVVLADLPPDLDPAQALTIVPSPRAALALAQQAWFPRLRDRLDVATPGPETTQTLQHLGLEPVWTAKGGFRRHPLPEALASRPRLYLGNAGLKPEALALELNRSTDLFLPVYHRRAQNRAPWTPLAARQLSQAEHLTVLALSPSQRAGFEHALSKLGPRRPSRLRLVTLTDRTKTRFSAQFWTEIAQSPEANRESLLNFLLTLSFS